jgi:hypothetical protein
LVIELTPGPNMAYLAVLSAGNGRRAGFAATLGIALGLLRDAHPCGQFYGAPHLKEFTKPAGSRRRALLRWVQIALKPASKTLGLHGVFIRGKGLKYVIADSAFKRMQVDAPGACWLNADEHHLGLALRTGGALNCNEWNDGRQALRLGHDASLE